MDESHSITRFIMNLKEGKDESEAQDAIWKLYFGRLVSLARTKLGSTPRRVLDEEDVVVTALANFFCDVTRGKFPSLADRNGLWPLLAAITTRKAVNQRRYILAAKFGGSRTPVDGASGAVGPSDLGDLDDAITGEVTPELADELFIGSNDLINSLKDPQLRTIAIRRLQGYTTSEIAQEMGCVKRTIERKIDLIRDLWRSRLSDR